MMLLLGADSNSIFPMRFNETTDTHTDTQLGYIEYMIETIACCSSIEDENTGSTTDWSRATSDCFVSISTDRQTNTLTHTQLPSH